MIKWIGQHIWDFTSRFRADVYFDEKVVDSAGSAGTSGQILTSTSTATVWTDGSSVPNRTFIHIQNNASATWVIQHNLSSYPSVTVVDTGGSLIRGEVVFNTVNKLTITFFSSGSGLAVDGKAFLN